MSRPNPTFAGEEADRDRDADFDESFLDNPEPRCPVMLLLDSSESMTGAPLKELEAGLMAFRAAVARDELAALRVEAAITTFGGGGKSSSGTNGSGKGSNGNAANANTATLLQDFATVDAFAPPRLTAAGKTPLGAGLDLALDTLEARKAAYKAHGIPYYRPWLMLITDGAPTDGLRWQEAAMRAQEADLMGGLSFFAIGVEGADFDTLAEIAPAARPPMKLKGLRFVELFRWLSASVCRVSTARVGAETVALPAISGWAQVPA